MFSLSKWFNSMNNERNQLKAYSYQQRHLVCNCTEDNVVLTGEDAKCRYAKIDTAGIIKVDYQSDNDVSRTEVLSVSAGEVVKIPNITKVYRYYVGTTACTTKVYTDAGLLVTGLKLCY